MDLTTKRILIADQSSEFVNSLVREFGQREISADLCPTGAHALTLIAHEKPSLFIVELHLPDMRGEDVCRILKMDPSSKDVPIMVVTSKAELQSKLYCLELGVEEYLVKPVAPEEIVARANRLFKLMSDLKSISSSGETSRESPAASHPDISSITLPTIHIPAEEPVLHPPEPSEEPQGEIVAYGTYRTESIAGTGGMGFVYKAYDESLDRYVAIKVLSREWSGSPEFVERFQREAKLIAAINHPGIAQIYTFAQQNGESYFALQWCPGGSLSNLIKSRGRIELLPAIDIIEQCAKALEAASAKGVVHKDIKPSNLMFDEDHNVKIVDFGISSSEHLPEQNDRPPVIVGSPAYISPEQGRAQSTDHRTDIYSLGITFYQMLYGRLPFSAKSAEEYIEKHNSAPFPPYDNLQGKLPRSAYKIIERMTQKAAVARYQKYSELLKDLEKLRRELYSRKQLKVPFFDGLDQKPLFESDNFFDVLSNVFRGEQSGILKVSWGSLEKKFLILRNELVHFESPQTDENIWLELVHRKMLKEEERPSDQENLEESINRLLYTSALNPDDFATVYRDLMLRSIEQVFLWPISDVRFYQGLVRNEPLAGVPLSQILMKTARSILPIQTIREAIPETVSIVRTARFQERLKALNLSRDEYFIAARIEGDNLTLAHLQALTTFDMDPVARTVHVLQRTGAVQYKTPQQRKPRRPKEERSTVQPLPTVSETPVMLKVSEVPKSASEKPKVWLDAAPKPDPRIAANNYKVAQVKYQEGHYWEVIRLCGQAIRNNPSVASYHYLMGLALTNFPHSVRAAVESFRQALGLDPRNSEYRLRLVNFLMETNQMKEAYIECRKALELSPTNDHLARLLRQLELEK